MKPLVTIIIPVIRPVKAARCIEYIYRNSGISVDQFEIITEVDEERIGAPRMVQKLTKKARGQMICFLGDDTVPKKDFLKHALKAMKVLPDGWGMVGFDDNIRQPGTSKAAAHWLCDKRLLPLLGGEFFHTGYKHCWCDNELVMRCIQMGRYIFSKQAFIYHDHPIVNIDADDPDYRRIYSQDWMAHDLALYRKRSQNNWKNKGGLK